MSAYSIVTKPDVYHGGLLYAAKFPSGYHTVWYSIRANAVAAGERRKLREAKES